MIRLTGHFETPNAGKYIGQLCKHFGHKVEVEYDETTGRAELPLGTAHMVARDGVMEVVMDVSDESRLSMAKDVIDRHLVTFAFREDFQNMNWTETALQP
ncbi:DUF2218 domain-containing protein [Amaricoccus tamworthensis]|uniref:DUF2218 domain-containing protein n=1 Tax=Amaricoccus tamworthensis TaxID=57002 RepID=UPI003C799820